MILFDPLADGAEAFEHPALTEPHSKEAWRAYLDYRPPVRPQLVDPRVYAKMTSQTRAEYDRTRAAHHSALLIASTQQLTRFHATLNRTLLANAHQPHGARNGLVVTGPPRTGKSTMVKTVARDFEHRLRRDHPDYFASRGGDVIPVAYLLVPETATPKSMLTRLANYYGLPTSDRMTVSVLTEMVVKCLERCRTQLVVIDDLHFIDLRDKDGARSNTLLKSLANSGAATFVHVGVDLENSKLFSEGLVTARATQTSGRNTMVRQTLYACDTQAAAKEWVQLIASFEGCLVLLNHEPKSLARQWRYLHDRTGGSISALANLIRQSALSAQGDSEAITVELMETIPLDHASEAHRLRAAKKAEEQNTKRKR